MNIAEGRASVMLERAFGVIVARLLGEYQSAHRISDDTTSRLARVSQSYWCRVRTGSAAPGERLISGLAVSMPDLLRSAIDEVQELKGEEIARLRASSPRHGGGSAGAGLPLGVSG
jgi:hypothetical protein